MAARVQGRILAIDLGTRRIGLAISDPLGWTARGLPTLVRRNQRQVLNSLKTLAIEHGVSLIVLGNPVNMNGTEGPQSAKARKFAGELEKHLKMEVRLQDERLTSVEAGQRLRQSGVDPAKKPEAVDQMAAILILQEYLESERVANPSDGESGT